MNYIFVQIGKIPKYLKYSIEAIKIEDKPVIHLITTNKIDIKNVNNYHANDFNSEEIDYIKNLNYFETLGKNPLWDSSLLRIFYIKNLTKKLDLNNNIHFDSDVLIYKSFNEIKHLFKPNKLNITPLKENELVFGYSFFDNSSIIEYFL